MKLMKYTFKKKIKENTLVKMNDGKFAIIKADDNGKLSLKSDDQLNYYVKYINNMLNDIGDWYDYMCHYTEIEYVTNITIKEGE